MVDLGSTNSISAGVAFWLGLYATGLSSMVAILALAAEVLQRVRVKAEGRFYVKHKDGSDIAIRDAETLKAMNVPQESARPVLTVTVMNRGRRPIRIDAVAKARFGQALMFEDLLRNVPFDVEPGRSHRLLIGARGGFIHGTVRPVRFFVVDGADRIHPLSERWRQRAERALPRRFRSWLDARRGESDEVIQEVADRFTRAREN